LRKLLDDADDIEVIGEAQDSFAVLELVAKRRPQILLLDLVMPGPRPHEIERWVRKNYPDTHTLVLTSHDRDAYLTAMIDAGASGYVLKSETEQRLIYSIRRTARGEVLFDSAQYARAARWREEVMEKLNRLTPQERKVLERLAEGLDNKAIAKNLEISPKTTAYHITNVLRKLQVESRQKAVVWALKHLSDNLE
jgi:DNA-binding NarL/FixJ family response regulator